MSYNAPSPFESFCYMGVSFIAYIFLAWYFDHVIPEVI